MSCLRDAHLIRDTPGEIAYHASIPVAFIVETIKIACRVAAQPARRAHTAAAVSSRAGGLTRATGARTIGASRMMAAADGATADPTPAADQPARHRRPYSAETLRL